MSEDVKEQFQLPGNTARLLEAQREPEVLDRLVSSATALGWLSATVRPVEAPGGAGSHRFLIAVPSGTPLAILECEGDRSALGDATSLLCQMAGVALDRVRQHAEVGDLSRQRDGMLWNMPDVVLYERGIERDADGGELRVIGDTERMFGLTHEQVLEVGALHARMRPEDREASRRAWVQWLENGCAGQLVRTARVRHGDGEERWIEDRMHAIETESGRRLIGVMIDVSERQAADDRLRSSESAWVVFDRARAASIVFDRNERILKVNPSACRMYGYTAEEMVGATLDLIQPPERRGMDRTEEILSREEQAGMVIQHRRRDGSTIEVDIIASEVVYDGQPAVLSLNRDVTAARALQEMLDAIVRATEARTGQDFFHALTRNISKALQAEWVGVGQLDGESVRLVSVFSEGRPTRTFEYALAGTPCEGVLVDRESRYIKRGVVERFPDDPALAQLGLDTYAATPLIGSDNRVLGIVIAANGHPFDEAINPLTVLQLCAGRATAELERLNIDSAREEAEARFTQIAENMSEVFWLSDRATGRMLYVSNAFATIWGRPVSDVIGRSDLWREGVVREDHELLEHAIRHAPETNGYDIEYRIRRPDGEVRWLHERAFPVRGRARKIVRIAGFSEDVTDRREAEEHRSLMVRELNHRVKNNLNAVIGLAEQTLRDEGSIEGFRRSFFQRVRAMARSHTMIAEAGWRDVSLPLLVHDTLEAFLMGESKRLVVHGPEVSIPGRVGASVAMALYELATNAVKHGAFTSETGRVEFSWSILETASDPDGPGVCLTWMERGGPPVTTPAHQGFGTRLIERAMDGGEGSSRLRFEPEGLCCEMTLPVVPASLPGEAGVG